MLLYVSFFIESTIPLTSGLVVTMPDDYNLTKDALAEGCYPALKSVIRDYVSKDCPNIAEYVKRAFNTVILGVTVLDKTVLEKSEDSLFLRVTLILNRIESRAHVSNIIPYLPDDAEDLDDAALTEAVKRVIFNRYDPSRE